MDKLLEHRRIVKKKKPVFVRQDSHKKGKIRKNWRRPRGSDSKMRASRKGYRRSVRTGWGSPSKVRGLCPNGLSPVVVDHVSQLDHISPEKECVVLSSSLGLKKSVSIVEEALKKGFKFGNLKDPSAFVEEKRSRLEKKRKASAEKKKSRSEKKEKAEKEAKKKKESEKKKAEKEKAEKKDSDKKSVDDLRSKDAGSEEKKEQDKVLTKKQ